MGDSLRVYWQLEQCLNTLTIAMQKAGLWADVCPSQEALRSQMPFACDTLRFEQWLQFIFVPKMMDLLEQSAALPESMAITPIAEEMLGQGAEVQRVIHTISEFDRLINECGGK